MGKLVHLFYVLTFVSALVAAWPEVAKDRVAVRACRARHRSGVPRGRQRVREGQQDGALHAFHAALVPIVFVIAFMIAWRTWKMLQGTSATTETATT